MITIHTVSVRKTSVLWQLQVEGEQLFLFEGARWRSGRASDSESRGPGFSSHRRHGVVSLSKTHYCLNPGSVDCPDMTEKLLTKTLSLNTNKIFLLVGALHPSQQQWSCRDVASILWDFYPTLGCHDTQNVLHKYNHPTKPIRLICMDGLTKPLFLGRLRHERCNS